MKGLKEAGYYPKEENGPVAVEAPATKGEKKKRYATITANDLELPIDFKGVESGDHILLNCLCNVDEVTSIDEDKGWSEERKRFTLSIIECSSERALSKDPAEMTDEELKKANRGEK